MRVPKLNARKVLKGMMGEKLAGWYVN